MEKTIRLLFILSELPFPVHKNGVALINYHLLKYMPKNWSVDIVSEEGTAEQIININRTMKQTKQIIIPDNQNNRNNNNHVYQIIRDIFSKNKISNHINIKDYDMIYISSLTNITKINKNVPIFLNAIDSYSLLNRRFFEATGRVAYYIREQFYKIFERTFLSKANLVNFVSEVDAEWARKHAQLRNIIAIPNGVDVESFFDRGCARDSGTLLLTGQYRYQPNREAVSWMVETILPLVRAEEDMQLQIVGKDAPMEYAGRTDINVVGFVEDIADEYRRCEIFVCPLRSGAGIKNKVLEAMACGIPVVSTRIGIDGIDGAVEGSHFLLADTPQAFADAIISLHRTPELRKALARNGIDLITSRYQWSTTAAQYYEKFAEVMKSGH